MKKFESENSLITDLITEIENKINMTTNIVDQEQEVKKLIGNDGGKQPDILDKGYTYATYNKYEDLEKDNEDEDYPKMSRRWLDKFLCSNFKLYYRTHELNECLYLHFKGFRQIENLDTFINLKVLYLEGNSIKKIQGLSKLVNLTSLYLHQNLIENIEGLDTLGNLYNLNLSDNCISKIENLEKLEKLSNLLIKGNRIGINGLSDLNGLKELSNSVSVVDMANNRIDDANILNDILIHVPSIKVLYLQGNECVRKISHYRKNLITNLKNLTYLDDKPVFEDERRFAEAFARGGLDEEKKERALYRKEKEDAELKRIKDFREMIENWKGNKNTENTENDLNLKSATEKDEDRKNKLLQLQNKNILRNNAGENKTNNLMIKEETIDDNIFENTEVVDRNTIINHNDNDEIRENDNGVDSVINHNYKIKSLTDSNAQTNNDLPDLETVKTLKETGYIDYILEKENYDQDNKMTNLTEEKTTEAQPKLNENPLTVPSTNENHTTNFDEVD